MRINGMMLATMIVVGMAPFAASAMPKSDGLDVRKPAAVQFATIRSELGDGKTFSEISLDDRSKVQVALARMERTMNGRSVEQLNEDERLAVFNDQELVNGVLTKAREDSRMVCRREKTLGSHMPTNQCMTVAERRRQTDVQQRQFMDMRRTGRATAN